MKLIIEIPEKIYKASQIIGGKFDDVIQIPLEVIANCTPIPDNATVCDIEQIKAEIMQLDIYYDNDYFSGNRDPMYKCNEVLQIIDNYMKGDNNVDSV